MEGSIQKIMYKDNGAYKDHLDRVACSPFNILMRMVEFSFA